MQHHCDGRAAKRTARALVVHSVGTRLTETLITARHQRESSVTRCHETHFAGVNCVGWQWHSRCCTGVVTGVGSSWRLCAVILIIGVVVRVWLALTYHHVCADGVAYCTQKLLRFSLHSWYLKSFLFWRLSIRYRSCFFHSCIFHSCIFLYTCIFHPCCLFLLFPTPAFSAPP